MGDLVPVVPVPVHLLGRHLDCVVAVDGLVGEDGGHVLVTAVPEPGGGAVGEGPLKLHGRGPLAPTLGRAEVARLAGQLGPLFEGVEHEGLHVVVTGGLQFSVSSLYNIVIIIISTVSTVMKNIVK